MIDNGINLSKKENKRIPALDVARCIAYWGVVSVHFFLNCGFYNADIIDSRRMFAMVFMRSFFMYCVPLFLLISGYLECHKTLSLAYYKKIGKVYFVYVCASLFCLFGYPFLYTYSQPLFNFPEKSFSTVTIKDAILGILGFSAAPYAWYIEMYFGLFLIIPFLNILYNGIQSPLQKKVLLSTCVFLTTLPSIVNVYTFSVPGWWEKPTTLNSLNSLNDLQKIIPASWMSLYPITYYFFGCFFREYKVRMKPGKILFLLIIVTIITGVFNLWRSVGSHYVLGIWNEYYSAFTFMISILIFLFCLNIDYSRIPHSLILLLTQISELTLGAYLVSWVFDNLFYPVLQNKTPLVSQKLEYYFVIVPAVFFFSICVSFIIKLLYNFVLSLKKWITNLFSVIQ